MATAIEWTDDTWNPTDGCQVCSPGCANCYAMRFAGRFAKPGQRYDGLVTIVKNKRAIWTGEARLDSGKLIKPLTWRRGRKIFVNSMSDLFYEGFSNEQIAAVFGVMAACPQHTFQVLTKRSQRMEEWFEWVATLDQDPYTECHWQALCVEREHVGDNGPIHRLSRDNGNRQWPLPNVWLGVSVENQDAADERINHLLRTPAAVRMLSVEPLIGRVDLGGYLGRLQTCDACAVEEASSSASGSCDVCVDAKATVTLPGIDWVIVGCESGPGARPCDTNWIRAIRDQCAAVEVPVFLKQAMPDYRESPTLRYASVTYTSRDQIKQGGMISTPYLDGRQHTEFPR